jgi:transposase-like protein
MNKFPVSLLRQLLGCMQDGLSIRVTAQKLGISKSSVSLLSQTAVKRNDFFPG